MAARARGGFAAPWHRTADSRRHPHRHGRARHRVASATAIALMTGDWNRARRSGHARRRFLAMQLDEIGLHALQWRPPSRHRPHRRTAPRYARARAAARQARAPVRGSRWRGLAARNTSPPKSAPARKRRVGRFARVDPADFDLSAMRRGLSPAGGHEIKRAAGSRGRCNSAAMARAAAAGSAAPVIGRPMTRISAPACKASAGVISGCWSPRSPPRGARPA